MAHKMKKEGSFLHADPKSATVLKYTAKIPQSGDGGGGNMPDLEVRVARLEADVKHIQADVTEIKSDIKSIRSDMRSDFKWTIGIGLSVLGVTIAAFASLGAMMAHGFHWF
jgi:hypothetical protein